MLSYGHPGLLCGSNLEVKGLNDGDTVYFPIEHSGQDARAVSMTLEGERIRLKPEPKMEGARGYYYLEYPYEKAKHGKEQRLVMSFETEDGIQDAHVYLLVHGCRVLKRVDPVLP